MFKKPLSSLQRFWLISKRLTIIAVIILGLLMPELLWHKFTFIVHILYEAASFLLEEFLMHTFGLTKHLAQISVFYFSCALAILIAYRFWRRLPYLLAKTSKRIEQFNLRIKLFCLEKWLTMSIWQKIKFTLINLAWTASGFLSLLA